MDELIRAAFETAPLHLAILDAGGAICRVNRAWRRFAAENGAASYMVEEGANYLEVCRGAGGPGAADAAHAALGIQAVIDGQRPGFEMEYPCHAPHESRWFLMRVAPFDEPPPRPVVVSHEEITARRHAEDGLRLVVMVTQAVEEAGDFDAALLATLRLVCDLTGWSVGQAWTPDGAALARHAGWAVAQPGAQQFLRCGEALGIVRGAGLAGLAWSSGQPQWVADVGQLPAETFPRAALARELGLRAGVAVPIAARGEVLVVLEFFTDQARPEDRHQVEALGVAAALLGGALQRKQGEAEVRRYAAALERSNRDLQDFAAIASHDLQEPLHKMQGFSRLLRHRLGDALDGESAQMLAHIEDGATRLQALTDDLLNLARLAVQPTAPQRLDLNAVAREVLADLEPRLAESGGQISLGDLPALFADPLQMRQLLQNLLGNALKFHRTGVPPRVEVSATIYDGCCRLRVRDNGIGIAPEQRERIFAPFERLHPRHQYAGSGIGLAICRRIAERHGGCLTVESTPGEGSTFTVELAVCATERMAGAGAGSVSQDSGAAGTGLPGEIGNADAGAPSGSREGARSGPARTSEAKGSAEAARNGDLDEALQANAATGAAAGSAVGGPALGPTDRGVGQGSAQYTSTGGSSRSG